MQKPHKLYIVLISVHGLVRGDRLELGCDADTGGQILYAVELLRALARHPQVRRVDLLTRLIEDANTDPDYAQEIEKVEPGANIVRIRCGPRRYIRKELLWPHLEGFIDNSLQHFRKVGHCPDLIHSHYADGGYVGAGLAQLIGVPLIHTGHSLGRVKKNRLMEQGMSASAIQSRYNIRQRIEAEEVALGNAAMVITSTRQELMEQYRQYENYHPVRDVVIPPGVDLVRFHPPNSHTKLPAIHRSVSRFLEDPNKPVILALSRPDERKNIRTLIKTYGKSKELRKRANLVIIAGNRDDICKLDEGAQKVLTDILLLLDRYDLYGHMAIPKHHLARDVPELYRMATMLKGVFVNPALTEPFGLTLIEAAASGLPVVATADGGPKEIIANCCNGKLIDPLNSKDIEQALVSVLRSKKLWQQMSINGVKGSQAHYTWDGHVSKYMKEVNRLLKDHHQDQTVSPGKSRLPGIDRILVCDIDNTLLGERNGLAELVEILQANNRLGFAVATGRRIQSALDILEKWKVPTPDILITSVGAEIYYRHKVNRDKGWQKHIDYKWNAAAIKLALRGMPGLKLQPASEQLPFKISYYVDTDKMPSLAMMRRQLRLCDLHAKLILSHDAYLDVLPVRVSKGLALRYLTMKWAIQPECMLVAGDSGNDEEMFKGNTLGVVVGNYSKEIERLRGKPRIYFADAEYANGVLEGIQYYDFLERIRIPNDVG
ncbi:MAG TPA: HAD-IIB family hydrolase [Gammaproteobacteria bacterium]|nr:HAD-IIB family hydrolase [Gammaproteobacteria bacterium]